MVLVSRFELDLPDPQSGVLPLTPQRGLFKLLKLKGEPDPRGIGLEVGSGSGVGIVRDLSCLLFIIPQYRDCPMFDSKDFLISVSH